MLENASFRATSSMKSHRLCGSCQRCDRGAARGDGRRTWRRWIGARPEGPPEPVELASRPELAGPRGLLRRHRRHRAHRGRPVPDHRAARHPDDLVVGGRPGEGVREVERALRRRRGTPISECGRPASVMWTGACPWPRAPAKIRVHDSRSANRVHLCPARGPSPRRPVPPVQRALSLSGRPTDGADASVRRTHPGKSVRVQHSAGSSAVPDAALDAVRSPLTASHRP